MRDPPGSYLEVIRNRYRVGGSVTTGQTTPNQKYQVGPEKGIPAGTNARYATLTVDGPATGGLYYGRSNALGTHLLGAIADSNGNIIGDAYTFDYVDVSMIVLQDNGTATKFTLDFTGP